MLNPLWVGVPCGRVWEQGGRNHLLHTGHWFTKRSRKKKSKITKKGGGVRLPNDVQLQDNLFFFIFLNFFTKFHTKFKQCYVCFAKKGLNCLWYFWLDHIKWKEINFFSFQINLYNLSIIWKKGQFKSKTSIQTPFFF